MIGEGDVLGELQVEDDGGRPVPVRGAKQRALLTRLAVNVGHVVSVDRLVDELWGDGLLGDVGNALQHHVSRLRDNCEHLLDGVAEWTSSALAVCSDLHVLATSREPLGVVGEVQRFVPPLAVPALGVDDALDDAHRPEELGSSLDAILSSVQRIYDQTTEVLQCE